MNPTDTQRALLQAAAHHPQRKLAEFPANLNGGARTKVLTALCNAHWIEPFDPAEPEHSITALGLQAIGMHADESEAATAPHATRSGTKQAALIDLLKRAEGATLQQMTAATGWQVHTVRGAMAGALKKKLGLEISSEKQQGAERVYRITNPTT